MQTNTDHIIRDCCEAEVAEFGKPDTICITVDDLREIVQRHSPGQCLHQIQEPSSAEQAAWHAGLDGGRAQAAANQLAAQHPDDAAVDALASLMKAKLAKQRDKGYGGWDTDCTRERLSELLRGHVDKGDPVDVANFCAFLSARGESISPQAAPAAVAVPDGWKLVPAVPTLSMGWAYLNKAREVSPDSEWIFSHPGWEAALSAAPQPPALAATLAAAAQVVRPEPQHWVLETQAPDREFDYTGVQKKAEHWKAIGLNPTALFTEQQLRAALLAGVSAPAAQAGTFMTEDQACNWAWNKVREDVGAEGWTAGDSANYYGFFLFGWNYRGQYELQRSATIAAVKRELMTAPQAQADERDAEITWPKARDVGRFDDMSPGDSIRVGLDSDNDVYVSVCGGGGVGSVEFCNPGGGGGGKSSRTRLALLALMVAMEADNADDPARDWWARRNTKAAQQGGAA